MANVHSFEQLAAFLSQNQIPHTVDVAHTLIEVPARAAPLPGNLVMKFHRHMPFINIIQFMVNDVPPARVHDLETAIIRLNCLYEVPGFGLDHDTRRLYYRLAVPIFPPDGINPLVLNELGKGVVKAAREFYDAFQAVLAGRPGTQMDAILAEIAAQRKASQSPPS
jgi:hypothetical protein